MKYKYCPMCGKELEEKYSWDEGGVPYCSYDDAMFFDTPKPCIMVGVIKEDEILLLKQSYIYKNSKVLLCGYIGNNEKAEDTVLREVKEESGIEIKNLIFLGTDYVENKDLLMITFMAEYESGELVKSDEVEELGWVKLNDALSQMEEDVIGKRIVEKIINKKKTPNM